MEFVMRAESINVPGCKKGIGIIKFFTTEIVIMRNIFAKSKN
jgi:hypothetical protein